MHWTVKHIIVGLIFLINSVFISFAQNASNIAMDVIEEIHIKNMEWATIVVEIDNATNENFIGELYIESTDEIEIIGLSEILVEVKANKKRFQPVRIRVKKTQKSGVAEVIFKLVSQENSLQKAITKIVVPEYRRVRVQAQDPQVFMQHIGDSITLQTQITNLGNKNEVLEIAFSLPKDMEYRKIPTQKISLHAYQDTVITYKRLIDKRMMQTEQFYIHVAVLNENKEFVGNATFQIHNTASSRQYVNPKDYNYSNNVWGRNQISIGLRNIAQNSQAYTIQGRVTIPMQHGELSTNMDVVWWEKDYIDPLMTNTWVSYANDNLGVHLGTLQDNDSDVYISGSGASVFKEFKNSNSRLSIGFSDRSYNILKAFQNVSYTGYNLFAKLQDFQINNTKHNLYYVLDKKYDNQSHLIQDRFRWNLEDRWSFDFSLAVANTEYESSSITKNSAALDFGYQGKVGNYNLRGRNSWSSPYYPGVRRGILALNNRISTNINEYQLWLHINYYKNTPKYMQFTSLNNNRSSYSFSGGISGVLKSRLRYSMSPEYYKETGMFSYVFEESAFKMDLDNFYFHSNLSWYSTRTNQGVILNFSQGLSNLSVNNNLEYVSKANLSWSYKDFNTNLTYQHGSFFLSETAFNYLHNDKRAIERWMAAVNYNKSFYNNKFQANAQLVYQNDNAYGSNWVYSAMGTLALSNEASAYIGMQGYYYDTEYSFSPNLLLRAGVIIKLPDGRKRSSGSTGDLEVFVFYDNNNNDEYDTVDSPAKNRMVQVNGVNFITDEDGKVNYKKAPYGDYTIKVQGNEWYNANPYATIDSKKNRVIIPLQRTGTLKGKIDIKERSITDEEIYGTLGNIRILLTDSNGKEWVTRTDDQGNYSIYLPANTYRIYIPDKSLPTNTLLFEFPSRIEVRQGKIETIETIYLEAKKRDIEIKRFGQ